MANQTDTYKAEAKFTGVWVKPENLTIVGIDCPDDAMPDFADPHRIGLPFDDILPSIAEFGIREAVHVKKYRGDDRVYVVSGRRRVRAARAANASGASGDVPILVPCIPDDGDPLVGCAIENEGRVSDTPYARACKAQRMRSRGMDNTSIARIFNVTVSALRVWWLVLEAQPAVQQAVERGDITMVVASEIAKFAPAEQSEQLRIAIESGKGAATLDHVRAVKRASKEGKPAKEAPRRLSAPKIKLFSAKLSAYREEIDQSDVVEAEIVRVADAAIRAVLGDASALDPYPALQSRFSSVLNGEVKA